MENLIDKIVSDLIQLNPEFVGLEEDLRKLVQKLLAAKPDVEIDEAFKKRLQSELYAKALELQKVQKDSPKFYFLNPFKMQKLSYTFGGILLATLVFFTYQNFDKINFYNQSGQNEIAVVAPRAFGSLAQETADTMAVGKGGGGSGEGMAYREGDMPPYEATAYKYVYDGPIDLPSGDIEVLQRVRNFAEGGSTVNALTKSNFGLANFRNFENLKLRNFAIFEDKDFGYEAYVNFDEGSVSFNQNYQKWPDPYRDCRDDKCYEDLRLSEKDMLSETELISLADDFIRKFEIDLGNYGSPIVQNSWQEQVAQQVQNSGELYYPDAISLIYPLQINGETIYNENGDADGISISINQRSKKVSNVWGLFLQKYQASVYAGVQDETLFRKVLEKGGAWGWYPENSTKVTEIKLGAPEQVLVKHWIYKNGESGELVIPALRFPILEKPEEEYFYQKAVVIPLAQEILAESQNNIPVPILLDTKKEASSIANPASEKCEADGYILEIIKDAEGNESGFCKNEEGKGCDEWEYFRGECEIPAVG
ncbi:DUF333 domain-containing protein [Candidatus Gracilibacteria bacterium]|nr:DUF333 domain-containing protein [Candidatus Gracilibacteria bacterium]MCF7856035.1 DUF333 domain-containing protein [Candidatus Gracilibacteria bacterium]MCF7896410.1 DUF333 domain-containing protein [Candidatus Gracilibacteria bacterium]